MDNWNNNQFAVNNENNFTSTDNVQINNKGNVLVADDAAVVRLVIKNTLQGEYKIFEVANGDDAIRKLQELNYDAVMFLDLRMPESDGFKVLRVLDDLGITIPITVISGDDSMETIQEVCKKPNVDFINKPLGKPQVLAACERMFRQKAMYNNSTYQRTA